jgi:hypothetical protein
MKNARSNIAKLPASEILFSIVMAVTVQLQEFYNARG